MSRQSIAYALACVVVPVAWGLVVVWLSNRLDGTSRRGPGHPPTDFRDAPLYHI